MLRFFAVCSLALACLYAAEDPVQWTLQLEPMSAPPGSHVLAKFRATIEPGWHLYSLTTPKGGPIPTTSTLADSPVVSGVKLYQPKPERKLDPNFQIDTEIFAGEVVLFYDVELKKDAPAGAADITAQVRYQCCNDRLCLPPKRKSASASITIDPSAKAQAIAIPAAYSEVVPGAVPSSTPRLPRPRRRRSRLASAYFCSRPLAPDLRPSSPLVYSR